MKKIPLLISIALVTISNINAQEGSPSIKIFSNFNYNISTENGEDPFKAFEVKRSYLGYSYKIDKKFATKIIFDVGNNTAGSEYTAFLKIASLKWIASDKLSLNFGVVGAKNFKFMEKAWAHYLQKKN